MHAGDLYLLAPEISMAILGVFVVLADLLMRRKNPVLVIAVVGLSVPLALTIMLWVDVLADPETSRILEIGNVAGFVVDRFALLFKALVIVAVALVLLISTDYSDRLNSVRGEYCALILFAGLGMMLLAATTELIAIYVSLELATLPLVVLSGLLRNPRSTEAALKFFVLSAVSSALLLYGMVLIYGFTGSTQLDIIAQTIPRLTTGGIVVGAEALTLGLILVVAGFGFKVAVVPFHMWVPDVYEGAPTPITAYLSVASKAVGFAVLLRVLYVALGDLSLQWAGIFTVLAVSSMTFGNLVAIKQTNIKRMLAYSTIAHAGYILVGMVAIGTRIGDGATLLGIGSVPFYLIAYTITNLAVFAAVTVMTDKVRSDQISDLAGMAKRAPFLTLVLAVGLFSLTGIPPSAGFMGKLYLFSAAIQVDLWWLALVGAINSVLSAYYYLRVVRVMYLQPSISADPVTFSPLVRVALLTTVVGVLALGITPGFFMDIAREAAMSIVMGPAT